ncbi:MAG: acetylxylan esterase [Candidatus Latescibacteria bacterium]|nr:acetylxylan esterase [Candidatus Latescibacterota bacterium]
MATKILDHRKIKQLQPAHGLWKLYRPEAAPHHFRAGKVSEARRWQRTTRKALSETLGFQDLPPVPFAPRKIEEVDKGDYRREKVLIRISRDSVMPVYILTPKGAKRPLPVALAFHGHGYGVKDIVGLWQDGQERDTPDGYHKDFGVALCRRGFAVAAPEISCFGERQTDFGYLNTRLGQGAPSTCAHTSMLAFHLGGSPLGLRAWEGRRLIDYLQTRKDLDTSRMGAMGISGGGMHTFFSACLDERIRACVVSGYYCTFRDSVLAMSHCPCNFVPGLHQFGEMYDLAGLLAPRPLLIEAGTYDPIFPIQAVKKSVEKARGIYRLFGAQQELETDYFEGRHQISGRRAYDFLMEKLSA